MSQTPQFRGLKCRLQWQFKVRLEPEPGSVHFEIHVFESGLLTILELSIITLTF